MSLYLYLLYILVISAITMYALFFNNLEFINHEGFCFTLITILSIVISFAYAVLCNASKSIIPELFKVFSLLSITSILIIVVALFIKEAFSISPFKLNKNTLSKKAITAEEFINSFKLSISRFYNNLPKHIRLLIMITAVVIVSRFVIYLSGFLFVTLVQGKSLTFTEYFNMWNIWDSILYLKIAEHGYLTTGTDKFLIVFYPLYPFLVKLFAVIFRSYLLSAFILSNSCLVLGSYYLYKLVNIDYDEDTSFRSVKFLLIFPFSFFLAIAYTESLFIALSIMTLYFMRKEKWLMAGFYGLLAAFSKNFGILLFIPVCIEYIIYSSLIYKLRAGLYKRALLHFINSGIGIFLIPVGTLLYLEVNKIVTGGWFTFLKYQSENWGNELGDFSENLRHIAISAIKPQDQLRLTYWIPSLLSFLIVVFLIFYAFKRIRLSYIAYMAAYLVIAFSPTWLISAPRYILALAPIYIVLPVATKNKSVDTVLTFIFTMLLGFFTLGYLLGKVV